MGFDTERCLGDIVPFVINCLMMGIYVVPFCRPKLQYFISFANTAIGFTQNTTATVCISKQSHHTSYSPERGVQHHHRFHHRRVKVLPGATALPGRHVAIPGRYIWSRSAIYLRAGTGQD